MKVFLILSSILIAQTFANGRGQAIDTHPHVVSRLPHSPRCPFPDLNSNSTYFPHPKKCELFYECSNGVEVQFECPAGLHFNPTINVCDYPWRAGCVI